MGAFLLTNFEVRWMKKGGEALDRNLEKRSYICPHCHAYAGMEKSGYKISLNYMGAYLDSSHNIFEEQNTKSDKLTIVTCRACNKIQLWINNDMVFPNSPNTPAANEDMPENVKEIYNEATGIFEKSPRASAALLRLGVQLLCKELGEKGENINNDIAALVQKGLSVKIQRALDIIRVIGNNAVHPGTIDLNDSKEIAGSLFNVLNLIVDEMITKPKEIDALYDKLPPSAINAINRRDKEK